MDTITEGASERVKFIIHSPPTPPLPSNFSNDSQLPASLSPYFVPSLNCSTFTLAIESIGFLAIVSPETAKQINLASRTCKHGESIDLFPFQLPHLSFICNKNQFCRFTAGDISIVGRCWYEDNHWVMQYFLKKSFFSVPRTWEDIKSTLSIIQSVFPAKVHYAEIANHHPYEIRSDKDGLYNQLKQQHIHTYRMTEIKKSKRTSGVRKVGSANNIWYYSVFNLYSKQSKKKCKSLFFSFYNLDERILKYNGTKHESANTNFEFTAYKNLLNELNIFDLDDLQFSWVELYLSCSRRVGLLPRSAPLMWKRMQCEIMNKLSQSRQSPTTYKVSKRGNIVCED